MAHRYPRVLVSWPQAFSFCGHVVVRSSRQLEADMRLRVTGLCVYGLGMITILAVTQSLAFAAGPVAAPAPELDGASITAGVGLLAAGILILRSRRRAK